MPLTMVDRAVALLASLTNDQIEELPPAERRRLEHQCLAVAIRCAPVKTEPPGILSQLKAERAH